MTSVSGPLPDIKLATLLRLVLSNLFLFLGIQSHGPLKMESSKYHIKILFVKKFGSFLKKTVLYFQQ
jgi:hypothetical protein